MAGSSVIGALRVNLGLDSALFQAGAKKAKSVTDGLEKALGKFSAKAEKIGKSLSVVSAGMAAMGAAGLAFANNIANAGVEVDRFAKLANATPQQFQKWAAGAKRAGIEQDKLSDILKDVNDKVGDFFETGGGPMADFFENIAPKVGITAEAFRGLSGPDALQLYVSSLEKAGLNQQQMTFYMEALASDATGLLPLLQNNGKAMASYGDAAAKSGAIMSDKAVAASVAFKESLRTLQERFVGVQNSLAEHLLPIMTTFIDRISTDVIPIMISMAEKIGEWVKWFGELSPAIQDATGIAAAALGVAGPMLLALKVASDAFKIFIAATGPIGLFIAVATTAYMAWQTWGDEIKAAIGSAIDWITEKFNGFLGVLQSVIDKARDIKDAIASALGIGNAGPQIGVAEGDLSGAQGMVAAGGIIGGQLAAGAVGGVGAGIEARKAELQSYIDKLPDITRDRLGIHSPSRVFAEIGGFITQGLGLGIQQGQPGVQSAIGGLVDIVDGAGGSLSGSMASFASSAQSAFSSVIAGSMKVKDALKQVASQWLSSMANNFASSASSGLFKLMGFSNGTNFAPGGFARVHERGGEIMNLPRGTQVIPHDISKRMADNAGGGGEVNIHIDARGAQHGLGAEIEAAVRRGMAQAVSAAVTKVGHNQSMGRPLGALT